MTTLVSAVDDVVSAARPALPGEVVGAEARAAPAADPLAVAQLVSDAAGRTLLPSAGRPSPLLLVGAGSPVPPAGVELASSAGAQVEVVSGAGRGVSSQQPHAATALLDPWLADLLLAS